MSTNAFKVCWLNEITSVRTKLKTAAVFFMEVDSALLYELLLPRIYFKTLLESLKNNLPFLFLDPQLFKVSPHITRIPSVCHHSFIERLLAVA